MAEVTDSPHVRIGTDGHIRGLRTEARGMRDDGVWTAWRTVPEGGDRVSGPQGTGRT